MSNRMGLMSWCRNLLSGRPAANPEATLAAAEAGDVDAQFGRKRDSLFHADEPRPFGLQV